MYVLHQSIRGVAGPSQVRGGASKDVQRFLRLVDRRHAKCQLLCSHVVERYVRNELKL
jgi:hypothetical protein